MMDKELATIDYKLSRDAFIGEVEKVLRESGKQRVTLPLKVGLLSAEVFFSIFKCQRCGNCCTTYPKTERWEYIFFTKEEFQSVKLSLPRDWKSRVKRIDKVKSEKDRSHPLVKGGYCVTYPCMFYSKHTKGCLIYSKRPVPCRIYPLAPPIPGLPDTLTVNLSCPAAVEAAKIIYLAVYEIVQRRILQGTV